jgi:hypothetical protein
MSLEMTPQGQQADAILGWVFDDPEGRAAEGLRRLNELAAAAENGSQALREIQDAGTTVSRMLPDPPARTISDQMGGLNGR